MKNGYIFDLDGTVINSAHRTPTDEHGNLDLEGYFARKHLLYRDTLLPLALHMRKAINDSVITLVSTARGLDAGDWDFLHMHGLIPHDMFSRPNGNRMRDVDLKRAHMRDIMRKYRDVHFTMYDDNHSVLKGLTRFKRLTLIDSTPTNRQLAEAA